MWGRGGEVFWVPGSGLEWYARDLQGLLFEQTLGRQWERKTGSDHLSASLGVWTWGGRWGWDPRP